MAYKQDSTRWVEVRVSKTGKLIPIVRGGEAKQERRDRRLERQGRKERVPGEARARWRGAISARCIVVPFALGGKKERMKQRRVQPLRPPKHLCLLGFLYSLQSL